MRGEDLKYSNLCTFLLHPETLRLTHTSLSPSDLHKSPAFLKLNVYDIWSFKFSRSVDAVIVDGHRDLGRELDRGYRRETAVPTDTAVGQQ